MDTQKGFSLIELMVAVAIIGIITTIAVPSYQRSVMKTARGEGMSAILDVMRAQENFFVNNFNYSIDLTDLNYSNPHVTSNGRYSISASQCVGLALSQCVVLTATALDGQVDDGNLTLDSLGNRTHGAKTTWTK